MTRKPKHSLKAVAAVAALVPPTVPTAPPLMQLENASLELLEAACYHRNHKVAGQLMLKTLRQLRAGGEFEGHVVDDARRLQLYTRVTAALSAALADPGFSLSEEGYAMLCTEHEALQAVAEASGFDTLDHVVSGLATNPEVRNAAKYEFPHPQVFAKFLLTYCLNSSTELNFRELFSKAAQTALPLYLGLLAHRCNLHPLAHARREELLGLHALFKGVKLPDGLLSAASDAYMYCSYGVRADRHEVKRTLSHLLEGLVQRHCAGPSERELQSRRQQAFSLETYQKPRLLIPIEWMGSFHAMYRCYAPSIQQLREHFHVIGMCKEKDLDPVARQLFDQLEWLHPDSVILSDVVKRINELRPDVIYYPSVGMALWWVALAQVRLAPIQLLTLGHPATTMSPAMDYVIAERGQADPELFSERVLELPMNAIQFTERRDMLLLPPPAAFEERPEVLRVAIPSMVVKVTAPFLESLKRIQERFEEFQRAEEYAVMHSNQPPDGWTRQRLEFHFFPNMLGVLRAQAKRQLERWFPGCVVHGRDSYVAYMEKLARCHLHFSTFPFGGTNSLIDSMLLNVPIVCLEGVQPHEKFDALMLRRVELGGLVAQSVEEYEVLALSMLTDARVRRQNYVTLGLQDVHKEFFGEREGEARGAFGRAVRYVFEHHERIQELGWRYVPWEAYSGE